MPNHELFTTAVKALEMRAFLLASEVGLEESVPEILERAAERHRQGKATADFKRRSSDMNEYLTNLPKAVREHRRDRLLHPTVHEWFMAAP